MNRESERKREGERMKSMATILSSTLTKNSAVCKRENIQQTKH